MSSAEEPSAISDTDCVVSVSADKSEWDAFVVTAPDSTFCHAWGWREIMTGVLGHECLYLVARGQDGLVRGVLPLVRVRGLLGHFLVSLPFVNDGGPIGDEEARHALAEFAVDEAERSGAALLELRSRGPVASSRMRSSNRKVGVHLGLPTSVEALWTQTFKAKLRSQIRRPGKEGMTAHTGADQLDAFYRVFARNMRDLGTPVLPRSFFERLAAVFGDRVTFVSVRSAEGVPTAASCCLTWRDEIEVTWASSLREYNHLSPNMLLYATMMEHAVRHGVQTFNFGRSSPGAPTHRFKQQWGGTDVPLPWAVWLKDTAAGTPSPDSAKFRVAVAVWSRLPLVVANRIGPLLSRHLP